MSEEKNFEGKVLSPSSKTRKRSSKKTKTKNKICKTCGGDIIENENSYALRFQDTFHQIQTKQYCDDHEAKYSDHKCKPHWCGDCGFLMRYEIEIQKGK